MHITAMTHRDELFDLTLRWLNDDFDPDDGRIVSRIFLYESAVAFVLVQRMTTFLGKLFGPGLHVERVRQKQYLRERIIRHLPRRNPRIQELVNRFRENPEFFFPRLAIDAVMITTGDFRLAAIGRIKRLSRVAEKVSFRMVDALFREIQAEARVIAGQRAAASGIPLADLVSSKADMQQDFLDAEAIVARRFRSKKMLIDRSALTVNDLLGFKIIGDPELLERVPSMLREEPGVTLVEVQNHIGNYNAVNLLVDIELPEPAALASLSETFDWLIAAQRGLDPSEAQKGFQEYVARGAGKVRLEIILTTYDELMESEFGRSMHELRILRLRQRQAYCGPIAQNAAYLIEYLLTLASSPTVDVPELPIKMYGRYLPETVVAAKCALFGQEIDCGLLHAFFSQASCSG
ncbi:MAG TPA: hypothetical protein ENN39_13030 [Desulfonatronum sp.]|nr:hypothetical protein [Desulfonatronum sp.]